MEEVDEANPWVAIILSGSGGGDTGCVFRSDIRHSSSSVHPGVGPFFLLSTAHSFTVCRSRALDQLAKTLLT